MWILKSRNRKPLRSAGRRREKLLVYETEYCELESVTEWVCMIVSALKFA